MANTHLKNSTLPPHFQEAAQLIGWAIQRMLKFNPPEKQTNLYPPMPSKAGRDNVKPSAKR